MAFPLSASFTPTRRPRLAPLALAAHLALAATFTLGVATHAHAQSATKTVDYDIPGGPLADGLNRFAQQSGVSIVLDANRLRGLRTPGLKGRYDIDAGFDTLLRGSGFVADKTASGYVLRQVPVIASAADGAMLPATNVNATNDRAESLNPPTTVGSKSALTQREIPQTISVISQQQIQEQSMRTVDDAMRYAPGVTTEINQPGFSSYYSRGFPISTTQFDGVPTGVVTSGISGPTDNLAMYDRVEVLYGPAGLLNGFGGDGGILNLVRKRAPDQFEASVQASAGNYSNGDLQADIGGPLNEAGTLRGRIVADEQYQHLMQDTTWQRNQQFYGTLEADITPTTQVRIGASYSDTYGRPMYGFPSYTNYSLPDLSRSTYLGPSWNWFESQRETVFGQIEQKLANDWTVKLSYNYMHTTTDVLSGSIANADAATGLANMYSLNTDDYNTQHAIDVYATGPFQLLGRKHQLTIGANYLHSTDLTNQYLINPSSGLDFEGDINASLYDNSAYSNAFAGGPQNDVTTISNQYGIYGNVRFSLADPLTLVLSGRVTWWNSESVPSADPNNNYFGNVATYDRLPAKFSPMLGLVYDFLPHHTLYASYSSIYQPQAGDEMFGGGVIKPIEGAQYEVGEKSDWLDGRMSTSVALFHIKESNRAMSDPLHTGYYIAEGQATSQGVEFRFNGKLTADWSVNAGYTYVDWHNDDTSFTAHQSFAVVTPKHLFKLWTSYRLPGEYHRWTVSGGMYLTSSVFYRDTSGYLSNYTAAGGTLNAGGYATFDARVAYQFDKHWSAAFAVSNLFDRKYITSLTTGGLGNYYGNPRQFLLTLRYAI